MSTESLNDGSALIDQLTRMLEETRTQLEVVEKEYNRLRAQAIACEDSLRKFSALAEGDYDFTPRGTDAPSTRVRSKQLKDAVYEYFKADPRRVQSPRDVADHLAQNGYNDKNLHLRVSNLLRKVVTDEGWLRRASHGKYQYIAEGR